MSDLRYLFFCLLAMALNSEVTAQPCQLEFRGKVRSADQYIEGAQILLSGVRDKTGTTSTLNGEFRFIGICPGRYVVQVRFLGFLPIQDTLELKSSSSRDYFLEPDVMHLEEVVIHEHREDPFSALNRSQLSRQELEATAGKSLGEALREVTGVNTIQAGPGIFKPVIHGVHSQRILVLNHGVRQEGQQWGAEHAPEIDPFTASDIEVIKDASAIRYGVDAIGGVIIVRPPELPESPGLGGYFQTIGQSNGRGATVSGSLQGGINNAPGWGWRIQGTGKRLGDFKAANYNLSNTGVRELNFSAAGGYHSSKAGVEIYASRFQNETGILRGTAISNVEDLAAAVAAETPFNTVPFTYSIGEPRQSVTHQLVKVNAHRAFSKGNWKMQYAWQRNNRMEFDLRRGGLSSLPALDLRLDTHIIDQEWQVRTKEDRKLVIGMNGMFQDNRTLPGTQRIPFIPNFTSTTGGIYLVASRSTQRLTLDGGIRYDYRLYRVAGLDYRNVAYHERMSYRNASATGGLTLRISKAASVTSTLSSTWRPPHVAELFSLGTHQSAAAIEYGLLLDPVTNEVQDPATVDFRNEKAVKWVNTWHRTFRNAEMEVTGYGSYLFNYIWLRPSGITQNIRGAYPYFRYTQTDAFFTGLDGELKIKVSDLTQLTAKGSLLRASDVNNSDFLTGIPASRLELTIHRDFRSRKPERHMFTEIRASHVFRQGRAPRVITPTQFVETFSSDPTLLGTQNFDFMAAPDGYTLIRLNLGYTLRHGELRYDFNLSADNLLNTSYREYTNRFRYFSDDIGRNVRFSIKIIF